MDRVRHKTAPGFQIKGSPAHKGKSPQHRQWRMQQGDFEEVPRLAGTIVPGNRLARRWAGCPRSGLRGRPLPHPLLRKCLRRGTFCHQRQKVPKERRQNQWFWNPCAGVVRKVSGPFAPANNSVQTRLVLLHCLRLYPPRRAPRLCCLGITGLPPASTVFGASGTPPPTKFYR